MRKRTLSIPFLVVLMLSVTMMGCATKHEKTADVIEKSTTTTIERPVTQEKRTTTTTTVVPVIQEKRTTTTTIEGQ